MSDNDDIAWYVRESIEIVLRDLIIYLKIMTECKMIPLDIILGFNKIAEFPFLGDYKKF